ncbi:MAG: PEGA domain-containing protein [Trueperaceae bacterium]|nr:PEGA domain-containing protein [Trueperaceae bacterium]
MFHRHVARTTLALTFAALVLAACSSGGGDAAPASGSNVGTLRVSVDPSDATVTASREGTSDVARRGSGDVELDAGTYTVRATADGYRPDTTTARVRAGDVTSIELSLQPEGDASPTPPEDPGQPEDPEDMQYRGEWAWLLEFSGTGLQYAGFLSISESIEDDGDLTGVEAGTWTWCGFDYDACSGPTGVGLFATFERTDLVSSFVDTAGIVKAVSIDLDGRLEDTDDGNPAFAGFGEWSFYSGGSSEYIIVLVRVQETPVYSSLGTSATPSRPQIGPETRATLERRLASVATAATSAQGADALGPVVGALERRTDALRPR